MLQNIGADNKHILLAGGNIIYLEYYLLKVSQNRLASFICSLA